MDEKPVTIDDLYAEQNKINFLLNNYSLVKELGIEYSLTEKLYERAAVLRTYAKDYINVLNKINPLERGGYFYCVNEIIKLNKAAVFCELKRTLPCAYIHLKRISISVLYPINKVLTFISADVTA